MGTTLSTLAENGLRVVRNCANNEVRRMLRSEPVARKFYLDMRRHEVFCSRKLKPLNEELSRVHEPYEAKRKERWVSHENGNTTSDELNKELRTILDEENDDPSCISACAHKTELLGVIGNMEKVILEKYAGNAGPIVVTASYTFEAHTDQPYFKALHTMSAMREFTGISGIAKRLLSALGTFEKLCTKYNQLGIDKYYKRAGVGVE